MLNKLRYFLGAVSVSLLCVSFAFADTGTVTIQSIAPGNTVFAKNTITFNIVTTGFQAQLYQVSDSQGVTTVSANNIDPVGKLTWTPVATDVGVHTLTIKVSDFSGSSASTQITITVAPAPSLSIQSLSPGVKIMPGTKLSFVVASPGFTNPTFTIGDSFSGSSASQVAIDSSGNFNWTPDLAQSGQHTITVYATDSLGHNATVDQTVQVGSGPTLTIPSVNPSNTVKPGQEVTFTAIPTNFSPNSFSVVDLFSGNSTLSNLNINVAGAFAWTPQAVDVGTHVLTVTGLVGVFGDKATTSVTINVLGANGVMPTPASTSTSSSSDPLSALLAKLALLKAQVANQTGSAAATPATPATGFQFTLYLHPGSSGEEVTMLQNTLSGLGFLTVKPNGYYGAGTTAAVKKFQTAHGLSALGVVGPATRIALNGLGGSGSVSATPLAPATSSSVYIFEHFMGYGDTDPDVLQLQKYLISLNLLSGEPVGFYDHVTEDAIKKYQSDHGLPVTGYVGPTTRDALNKGR